MQKVAFMHKKIEKIAFIFNESCKELHLWTNIKNDSDIYSNHLFTYNAKYFRTLLREKRRSFANSLRSMLKLRFTVLEVVIELFRHR